MKEAALRTHKVTKTRVVPIKKGLYGVEFQFDDRSKDFAEVGDKETAEFYARVQLGEKLAIGVNPLLLNAEKAETLRE
jgi:hypothetical protein